jgi:hypothetical protein
VPRVVIELQANTQDAVQKIQQFAKAQKDAFDAIRSGTPALADAQVKISKLTETTRDSALATGDFNRAAQDLAKGGVRDLLSEIPILGGTFAKLASTLTGFPGLMLGVVGAGVVLIKMLQDMSAEASKTLASIEAMSTGIQTNLTATINQIAQLRAARAGDQPGAAQAGAAGELDAAAAVRDAAIKAAGQKAAAAAPGMFSPENIMAKVLGDTTLLNAKLQGIADERRTAELAAEAAFQLKAFAIREKLAGDLEKLDADRVKDYEANRDKEVAATEAAAEKEKAIWTQTTQDALTIFQGLGAGFEEAIKPLQLEQFVAKTTAQLDVLNTAIAQGRDTHGDYAKAVELLTRKMDEAVKLGYVPMTAAAKTATVAITESGEAARTATAKIAAMITAGASYTQTSDALRQAWLDGTLSLTQYNAELDKLLEKEQAGTFATKESTAALKSMGDTADVTGTKAANAASKAAAAAQAAAATIAVAAASIGASSDAARSAAARMPTAAGGGVPGTGAGGTYGTSGFPLGQGGGGPGGQLGQDIRNQRYGPGGTLSESGYQAYQREQSSQRLSGATWNLPGNIYAPESQYQKYGPVLGEAYTPVAGTTTPYGEENYQHGGLVPGVGPRPIIAHGGERILPVHGEPEMAAVKVSIEAGAVQLTGTIIDLQRDWGSLVEELGQALEQRLARRGR